MQRIHYENRGKVNWHRHTANYNLWRTLCSRWLTKKLRVVKRALLTALKYDRQNAEELDRFAFKNKVGGMAYRKDMGKRTVRDWDDQSLWVFSPGGNILFRYQPWPEMVIRATHLASSKVLGCVLKTNSALLGPRRHGTCPAYKTAYKSTWAAKIVKHLRCCLHPNYLQVPESENGIHWYQIGSRHEIGGPLHPELPKVWRFSPLGCSSLSPLTSAMRGSSREALVTSTRVQ